MADDLSKLSDEELLRMWSQQQGAAPAATPKPLAEMSDAELQAAINAMARDGTGDPRKG